MPKIDHDVTGDADAFPLKVDEVLATRAEEVTWVSTVLHAAAARSGGDVDEMLDDLLSELKGKVAADAANGVDDGDAEDAIGMAESTFTDDVSNAGVERRIAALLVGTTSEHLLRSLLEDA
jgi:hypothetical protein